MTGKSTLTDDVTMQGNASVAKDLTVTGKSTLTDDVTMQGNASVAKDLTVTGKSTLTDDVTMKSNASVGGNLDVGGNFAVNTNKFTVDSATGDLVSNSGTTTFNATNKITNKVGDNSKIELTDGKVNIDATETIFNAGTTNQVKIDSTGIRIGLRSTHMDNKGVYAGGHNWDEAKAAFNSKGEIKGAGGAFTVDAGGTTTIKSNKKGNDNKITLNADEGSITTTGAVKMAPGRVAPGSTDAVTGGQMYSMREDLQSDINRVGAGAAAMANLRPMDMGNKFSMAMGVGNYRSKTAMAMGMFYKPSDQVMVNMSGTIGSGHNMIGAGISFALDKVVKPTGSTVAASNAQVVRLEEENKAIKAELAELKAAVAALKAAKK